MYEQMYGIAATLEILVFGDFLPTGHRQFIYKKSTFV